MKKEQIRTEYLQKMAALTTGEVDDCSQAIAQQFFEHYSPTNQCIHLFLSIAKNHEINTFLIINKIFREHPEIRLVVPKSDFSNGSITSFVYNKDTTLKVNKLGIPEPIDSVAIDPKEIDIVLVPLLAFDKRGYRVGYGKGFYDRMLTTCRKDTLKIGLSLFDPIEEIEDTDKYDIALDTVITPKEIIHFKS